MIHLVTHDFPPAYVGGVAAWTLDLAQALHAAGAPVQVYARGARGAGPHDAALPFSVIRMAGRSWGRWQATWAALSVGPRLRPGDTLLLSTWPLGPRLAPFARGRGLKVGVAFHGSDLTRLQAAPPGLQAVLDASHARFAVSAFLVGCLRGLGGDAVRLPMPLELSALPPAPEHSESLVCVARLTHLKGLDRCLRLAYALGVPLEVVGEGEAGPALQSLAEDLGAALRMHGRLPRAQALEVLRGRRAALLLPRVDTDGSGAEGLGLCLLEAAAQGTPAVGCRTGGVPEASDLVLQDPDAIEASANELKDWLKEDRRAAAAARVRAQHGAERAARQVMEALT
ncbi:MAG: glycosyltransferase family 4 protein [Alphaproteobacteria bacterium]|nr:glycosyltransferase family 4 protein [Alphaproteobacteria bacterium]